MESEIIMANTIKTGLRPDSTENFIFGAGVLYKNFSYGTHYKQTFDKTPQPDKTYYQITGNQGGIVYVEFSGDKFDETTVYFEKYESYGGDKIGATKDGTKVSVTPEYTDVEVDGVLVKMKGLTVKTGEKGVIETIVVDLDSHNITRSLNGTVSYGGTATTIKTKSNIAEGDYISNLALVARSVNDKKMLAVVFETALCTSGLELDTKNKSISGNKYTFEAYAEQSDENVDTLPIKIIEIKETA